MGNNRNAKEPVYTMQDLRTMKAWPLERKIQVTQAKIIEWYCHYDGRVAVSWSAGKDSTVLLDLARRAFPDIPAVFVDTGLEYPEIREFAKSVPNVIWLRPELPFTKVIEMYGFPVISKDVANLTLSSSFKRLAMYSISSPSLWLMVT